MSEEPYHICQACGERIDPSDDDVVYAKELLRTDAMGSTHYAEGLGAFFHEGHLPAGSSRYRLKDKPTT